MATLSTRKLAVVTGASSGIGFELAKQCVGNDFDVLICAEDHGIESAATQLSSFGTSVEAVRADLATYDGVEHLVQVIAQRGRPVDALLLNAGVGVGGEFVTTDLYAELQMIALNCSSLVHLAKRIVPAMKARGQGRVLVTASIASTTPSPYHTVYGATKAFDLSFAEGLREELRDSGVTVTALQPGPTETQFFERADMENTRVGAGAKDDPADVAKAGFEAMMKGKDSVIASSLKTKLQGLANEILPETTKARMSGKQAEPGSGKKA
jgi:uncharacterized protein